MEKTWIPSLRDDAPRLSSAKKDRRWPTPLLGLPGMAGMGKNRCVMAYIQRVSQGSTNSILQVLAGPGHRGAGLDCCTTWGIDSANLQRTGRATERFLGLAETLLQTEVGLDSFRLQDNIKTFLAVGQFLEIPQPIGVGDLSCQPSNF